MTDQRDDEALLEQIRTDLRDQGQFVRHMPEDDQEGIGRIRSIGRRVGRDLGWKIRTFATDPNAREDRMVVVFVVVVASNPLHEQLMTIRGDKAVRKAFESWNLGGSDG